MRPYLISLISGRQVRSILSILYAPDGKRVYVNHRARAYTHASRPSELCASVVSVRMTCSGSRIYSNLNLCDWVGTRLSAVRVKHLRSFIIATFLFTHCGRTDPRNCIIRTPCRNGPRTKNKRVRRQGLIVQGSNTRAPGWGIRYFHRRVWSGIFFVDRIIGILPQTFPSGDFAIEFCITRYGTSDCVLEHYTSSLNRHGACSTNTHRKGRIPNVHRDWELDYIVFAVLAVRCLFWSWIPSERR